MGHKKSSKKNARRRHARAGFQTRQASTTTILAELNPPTQSKPSFLTNWFNKAIGLSHLNFGDVLQGLVSSNPILLRTFSLMGLSQLGSALGNSTIEDNILYFSANGTDYQLSVSNMTFLFDTVKDYLQQEGQCNVNVSNFPLHDMFESIGDWQGLFTLYRGLNQTIQETTELCLETLLNYTYRNFTESDGSDLVLYTPLIMGAIGIVGAITFGIRMYCCNANRAAAPAAPAQQAAPPGQVPSEQPPAVAEIPLKEIVLSM